MKEISKFEQLIALLHVLEENSDLELFEGQRVEESLKKKGRDTLRIEAINLLENLGHGDLHRFSETMESLSAFLPRLCYETLSVMTAAAQLMEGRTGFFVSSQRYPNLDAFLKSFGKTMTILEQLEVMRSQVLAQLQEGGKQDQNEPLGEQLLIVLILHAAYDVTEDPEREVYSALISVCCAMYKGLSFQKVMRLCRNVHDLLKDETAVRLLIVQNVPTMMSGFMSLSLMESLIRLRGPMGEMNPEFQQLYAHAERASKVSGTDMDRLLFLNSQTPEAYIGKDRVFSVEKERRVGWSRSGTVEGQTDTELTFTPKEKSLTLSFKSKDVIEEFSLGDKEHLQVDGRSFIYRADIHRVYCGPLVNGGLVMSNVQLRFKGNHILKDISLTVDQGEMLAVVGPSGCGKSTMLTMLAGMLEYSDGSIIYNGRSVKGLEGFSNICTYIPQDDILFRELTVHESIDNSLKLKVKGEAAEMESRLRKTIDVLGLERTEFLKIGNEGEKGISGGQRKRVNIGTTIVADMKPILLFDEPTSGLDPATDVEIMQLLRQLSRQGHIVMVVTHNLSAESLSYFDQLLVLDKTGRIQFFGREQRAKFFFNIRSTHLLFQKMKEEGQENYREKFLKTPEHRHLIDKSDSITEQVQRSQKVLGREEIKFEHRPGFFSNFAQFLGREVRRKSRDRTFLMMCLLQPVLIAVFIAWNFAGPIPNAIFSLLAATLWIGAISGVREINTEIPQLKRDYLYGTSLGAYLGAKVSTSFGFSAFQVMLLSHLLFLIEGYLSAPFAFSYAGTVVSLLLLNLFGNSLGLFISASIRSPLAAVGLLPVLLIPLLIMGGALIRHNQVEGVHWHAMKANPLRVSFESILFSSEGVIRPSLEGLSERSFESLEKQKASWMEYLAKREFFEADPQAYADKYEKKANLNDLFGGFLDGGSEKTKEESEGPAPPSDVEEVEFLVHRPDLWLEGQSFLMADPPHRLWFGTELYEVTSPKAFSESLSVQGAIGMFEKGEGNISWSIYRPLEYWLVPGLEILILQGLMLGVLLLKLKRKN